MKTWFTSDTHFGHANIIRYCSRPFIQPGDLNEQKDWISKERGRERCEEMDNFLIRRWNETVGPNDIVYHLGDFCMGRGSDATSYLARLAFDTLYFVPGNHDKAMNEFLKSPPAAVKFLGDMPEITIKNQKIILTHYAMRVWDGSHYGAWNLFGHSHGTLTNDPHSLSLDVGVDCHQYTPISFETVKTEMEKKFFKSIDKHQRKTGGGIGLDREEFAKAERRRLYEQLKKEFES